MAKFHDLKFDNADQALGVARRLAELSFEVFWTPSKPMVVRYTQAPFMPHPRQAGSCSQPAIPWTQHGIIDTRR